MNELKWLKRAEHLDHADFLAGYRHEFFSSDEKIIYLDGNSLGRMPASVPEKIDAMLKKQWGERLIRSWNENWMDMPGRIAVKLAQLLGCDAEDICVGDSTSVNLYKLAFAALKMQKGRTKIVSDSLHFPTDIYIMQGLIKEQFSGHTLDIIESEDGISVSMNTIADKLDENTALLTLSHVTYKSAHLYDMRKITDIAHNRGAMVLWDLSHSAGSVPVYLKESGADMAAGCTYKYLNGGPGSPAYLYVSRKIQDKIQSPVWGWFGHKKPFDFSFEYFPAEYAARFATGTPHILSLAAAEAGLDIILEAGMNRIRGKSMEQTSFLQEMSDDLLMPLGFRPGSPLNAEKRGSHLALRHKEGLRISQALINPKSGEKTIIPDFRPPDTLRLGIAPLYISFKDIAEACLRIRDIVIYREYELHDAPEGQVT